MKEAEARDKQQTDEILGLKEKLKTFEIKNNQLSQDIVEIESKNRELSSIKCTFQKSEFLVESMRKERDEFKERVTSYFRISSKRIIYSWTKRKIIRKY